MKPIEIGNRTRKTFGLGKILLVVLLIPLVAGIVYLVPKFEWKAPQITITPDTDIIGPAPLQIEVTEQGTGLKSLAVTLEAGGSKHSLAAEQYVEPVMEKKFSVTLSKVDGIKEGPAVLRVAARDRSLWRFFRGNESVVQRNITIDITPPTLSLIADDPYINFGGSGMIVYNTSPDAVETGVKIGDYFFPGYRGQTKDPNAYVAFFAHPYNIPTEERPFLIATDKAGNTRQMRLAYNLMNVRYRKSTIEIPDEFIENRVVPLLSNVGARQESLVEQFLRVNRDLRKQSEEKISRVTRKGATTMLWSGAFRQLSKSKVEANFADARTYVHQGKVIDQAYHLGFDLSVTKRYPVEAGNSGVIAFVGDLGIYGNTVVIDHGLGLFTTYSHLSSTEVKAGDDIKKGQIIGRTGETGLAAGDHLHFEVRLAGVPVLPLEWWDEKWIRDNITIKLDPSSDNGEPSRSPTAPKISRTRRR